MAWIDGFGLYVKFWLDLHRLTLFQVLGNLLALAGVCPFVGSLSDLVGRRYTALLGGILLCIGTIVATTAHTMNTFICESIFAPSRPED